jgi:hypothetical protein
MVVMVMMVVVMMAEVTGTQDNPHAMMVMVVMMMAELDRHLGRLHIAHLGIVPRIVGLERRHRIWHRVQELPIICRRIRRVPRHLRGIRAAHSGQGGRGSQKSNNFFVHLSSPKASTQTVRVKTDNRSGDLLFLGCPGFSP